MTNLTSEKVRAQPLRTVHFVSRYCSLTTWTNLPELTEPALGLLHPVLEHVLLDVEVGVVVVGEELRDLVRLPLANVGLHGGPRALVLAADPDAALVPLPSAGSVAGPEPLRGDGRGAHKPR